MEFTVRKRVPTLDAEGAPVLDENGNHESSVQDVAYWATFTDKNELWVWPSEEVAATGEGALLYQPWHPQPNKRNWIDIGDAVSWYSSKFEEQ